MDTSIYILSYYAWI